MKDRITRDILTGLEESGIEVASATYDVVGMPPLRLVGTVGSSPADDPRRPDDRA